MDGGAEAGWPAASLILNRLDNLHLAGSGHVDLSSKVSNDAHTDSEIICHLDLHLAWSAKNHVFISQ